jgi:fucose 4-O-acetylase-like acetyltransferase
LLKLSALSMNTVIAQPAPSRRSLFDMLSGPLAGRVRVDRQYDIDAARGLAIILVVIGHVVARGMPLDNDWYAVLKELIYRFHMPLFMALTGITFALALPGFDSWRAVAAFSRRKLKRLVVPYLFFGLLILAGKLIASRYMYVDNVPRGSLADDLLALIVRPADSAAGFLWFIYVLGLYFLALPAALQLLGRRPLWLMLLALLGLAVPWPRTFLLDVAFSYLPFFIGGMLLWMCRDRWQHMGGAMAATWMVLFAAALAFAIPLGVSKWAIGALSVPAVLGLAQHLPQRTRHGLAIIGQLSLSIYLMNTLAIGIVKALMLRSMPWDGANFLVFFPLLALAGVALPIVVKRIVGRRLPKLDRYV